MVTGGNIGSAWVGGGDVDGDGGIPADGSSIAKADAKDLATFSHSVLMVSKSLTPKER